jgi:hypothetical protein
VRSFARIAMSRRVVVNLTTGAAIEGILWDERGPLIVLRDARLHNEGGTAPLDGEVIIERDRIDFVQVVS